MYTYIYIYMSIGFDFDSATLSLHQMIYDQYLSLWGFFIKTLYENNYDFNTASRLHRLFFFCFNSVPKLHWWN